MSSFIYALGDADDVRKKLQGSLLDQDLDALSKLSLRLSAAMQELAEIATTRLRAEVVFVGGDDVLLRWKRADFAEGNLRGLMESFRERSAFTISFGVGSNTREAFLNLARSKSVGPGTLSVGASEEVDGA